MPELKKTPIFDFEAGHFVRGAGNRIQTVTGSDAVAEIAQKALNTQLGRHSVYGNFEDITKNHIYGSRVHDVAIRQNLPEEIRISEIERETKEALIHDPRIKDVPDVTVYKDTDGSGRMCYFTDVTITTYFNKEIVIKGVKISG